MKCKYITLRSYRKQRFWYCRKNKQQITYDDCKNCLEFECREYKAMKKKSKKLSKLEKERFSIFTNDFNHCYYCKKYFLKLDLHEIYGGSNRQRCMKNGLVIPLCRKCHDNAIIIEILKRGLQIEYEKKFTQEEFIQLIGKSYLD